MSDPLSPAGAAVAPAADGPARPHRRRRRFLLATLLVLLAVDLARPPRRQLTAAAELGGIHLYQATLSAPLGRVGVRCRFRPTCSHYAEGAIRKHGALVGTAWAAWRILRCGPWTKAGTVDLP